MSEDDCIYFENVQEAYIDKDDYEKILQYSASRKTAKKTLTEFDKDIFESIVEKIIVGGINSDGEIDPAMLTIIFKTGDSSTKDVKSYKSKRKNAKIENDKMCFNTVTNDEKKCTNKENSTYMYNVKKN